MPLPRSLSSYTHIQPVLDAALAANQRTVYTLGDHKQATRWRQEAYMYRKLLSDTGDNRFAELIMKTEGPSVIIERRRALGELIAEDGSKIDIDPAKPAPDTAEAFAADFARRLGLDVED